MIRERVAPARWHSVAENYPDEVRLGRKRSGRRRCGGSDRGEDAQMWVAGRTSRAGLPTPPLCATKWRRSRAGGAATGPGP